MGRTHGGEGGEKEGEGREVTVSSANHETAHIELSRALERFTERNPWFNTHSRFENRSRTTRSRVLQSFALPDEAVEGHCGGNQHTQHTYAPPLPSPLLPSLSHTHHAQRKRTLYMHVNMYVHVYLCIYVCICICICRCACICV